MFGKFHGYVNNLIGWVAVQLSLDIGRVCAVFGRVQRTSQIQARRVHYVVILDGYPFKENLYRIDYTKEWVMCLCNP